MAKKPDHKQMAIDIVRLVGGPENVQNLGHCMTRLRFVLKDESKADTEAIKRIKGVLGVVSAGGQYMVILGQNLLPVFEAAQKEFNLSTGDTSDENPDKKKEPLTLKSAVNAVLGYVSASVSPLITGLVAGGMLKVVLLLVTLAFPSFQEGQSYTLLSALADSAFYFMPIFVAYGAASKLGSTPIFAMICSAALLHGNYTALVAAGEPVNLLGIPVKLVSYSSSLLPALLIALVAYFVEKQLNKIIPGIFKSLLVGLGTIFITMILGYTILGPLGSYIGSYISLFFVFLGNRVGFIALAILAACLPWLVMCGMHMALVPFMTQAVADPGYDPVLRPAFILHNMAEGGACFGVGLRTKNKELRAEAFSIGFGCIVAGVTEPAIYGINLRLKKPMFGVMAGGAAGGIVAGLLGARAYVMGYSTILALPIFQDTIVSMAAGIIVAIITAAAVTFILGFEDDGNEDADTVNTNEGTKPETDSICSTVSADGTAIVAIADGSMIDIGTVHDETFASRMMGDGVAFELKGNTIAAPCTGTVGVLAETGHAFGITRNDDVEILVHIGIDTVEMKGKGFTPLVKPGDQVRAGQPVIKVDVDLLKSKGYDTTTMLIITDDNDKNISFKEYGTVSSGDVISL
ncbi:MAG: glucose PTS transporter subunit IIA [Lachnospiraceae bacterium]